MSEEKERNYIRRHFYKDREGYQLVIPASDTGKRIYIRHGQNIEELRRIRDILLKQQLTEKELLTQRDKYKKPRKEPMIEKYIKKTIYGKYNVRNNENNNNKGSYGIYNTIEEAREVRDKLIQNNWDKTIAGVVQRRRSRKGPDRHIYLEHGKYVIKRFRNDEHGKRQTTRYETGIKTIEEARELRDWWEQHNWDWENIDLI